MSEQHIAPDDDGAPPVGPAKLGRRRILGGAGASALAAAVAVFGKSTPAFAGNYGCCGLIFSPPNISMSSCHNVSQEKFSYYQWTCSNGSGHTCSCCEHYVYDTITGSAATCS